MPLSPPPPSIHPAPHRQTDRSILPAPSLFVAPHCVRGASSPACWVGPLPQWGAGTSLAKPCQAWRGPAQMPAPPPGGSPRQHQVLLLSPPMPSPLPDRASCAPVPHHLPHLAQEGSNDGRPLALHQALLVPHMALQEVPQHQQEGGHGVPLHAHLYRPPGGGQRYVKGLSVAEAIGTPASLSRQESLTALTQAPRPLYLRTCPVGEAGPGYCGRRSAQAPRGHVSQLDLPRPPGAGRPLAPAGAAGQPCLPHKSPHPRGRAGCGKAAPSHFPPHSTPDDLPVWEAVSRGLWFS